MVGNVRGWLPRRVGCVASERHIPGCAVGHLGEPLRYAPAPSMRFFEYESRAIVAKAGIPVTKHGFAKTTEETREIAELMNLEARIDR